LSPRVFLKKEIKRRVAFGHPWVYDNEIEKHDPLDDGCIVDVFTYSGQFLGKGYYNSGSTIRVRFITRRNCKLDTDFFSGKIRRAIQLKSLLLEDSDALRIVFGEADGLPGLIVDRFSDWLVVQFNTLGIQLMKKEIIEALILVLKPKGIFEKSEGTSLAKEGLEAKEGWLYGNGPELLPFSLNGISFLADTKGQKTGFFLDQRENRTLLKKYIRGGKGLDLFCYIGAWSMHLASAGAEVTGVDASERAVIQAQKIANMNNFSERLSFVKDDVFSFLETELASGEKRLDFIVLDPPAFVKSAGKIKEAVKAYRELNESCMRLLKTGGILATASCSYHLSGDLFIDMLHSASRNARRGVRLIEMRSQGPDHPVLLSVPETEYLKCAFLLVD